MQTVKLISIFQQRAYLLIQIAQNRLSNHSSAIKEGQLLIWQLTVLHIVHSYALILWRKKNRNSRNEEREIWKIKVSVSTYYLFRRHINYFQNVLLVPFTNNISTIHRNCSKIGLMGRYLSRRMNSVVKKLMKYFIKLPKRSTQQIQLFK